MSKGIPRDLFASELIKLLKAFGYLPTRQNGSHIRLTSSKDGEHHITIPNHKPLKLGTLNAILNDIALHHKISKQDLIEELF